MSGKTKRSKTPDRTDYTIDGHPDELMERDWVAWRLKVKVQTLNNWLCDPDHPFPKGVPLGKGARPALRWRRGVVNAYAAGERAAA